jgi:hypothetical protein
VSMSESRVSVTRLTLRCDNCQATEQAEGPIGGAPEELLPGGWLVFRDPRTSEPPELVTFHTKRCALGWMRARVVRQWAGDEEAAFEGDELTVSEEE